jgi:hypothetical protein
MRLYITGSTSCSSWRRAPVPPQHCRTSLVYILYLCNSKVNNVENHISNKRKENRVSEFISKADTDFKIKGNIDSKVEGHSIPEQTRSWEETDA